MASISIAKHLIIPTQYYDPEIFQVNYLCRLFLSHGWKITVIAPSPCYPAAYLFRGRKSQPCFTHKNLRVIRFPSVPRFNSPILSLINFSVYLLMATPIAIWCGIRAPGAHFFAVQYSPVTTIIPAFLASFFLNRVSSVWIFDLFPESLSVLGLSSALSDSIQKLFVPIMCFIYKSFSYRFISSPSFKSSYALSRFTDLQLLQSWEPYFDPPACPLNFLPYSLVDPDVLKIVSIGNLGSAHDLDLLEQLLLFTSSKPIQWTFLGGGSGIDRLRSFSETRNLANVIFAGFLEKDLSLKICHQSDLSLVPFSSSRVSDTVCFRFVSSLSVSTPVISFGDTYVSELVRLYSCGYVLSRDDASDLSSFVLRILGGRHSIRTELRSSSYALFDRMFSEASAVSSLSPLMQS